MHQCPDCGATHQMMQSSAILAVDLMAFARDHDDDKGWARIASELTEPAVAVQLKYRDIRTLPDAISYYATVAHEWAEAAKK